MNNTIRLLKAEEIDVRVGAIYDKGITLLLYKDARVDMNILDETFGPLNWKRKHIMYGDAMFCEVSIKADNSTCWISKMDLGSPSFSEPLKGAASDAFKRACTNWGIGRELYTAPFIWIPIDKVQIKEDGKGKRTVKDSFIVQTITYDEEKRCITGLVICNQNNHVVFQYMDFKQDSSKISKEQSVALLEELKRTGVSLSAVLRKHSLNKLSDMSPELWTTAMASLKNIGDRVA